jgi:hypothetical protein
MSLEAGNRRKSLVTLAVTACYFFSLIKNNERKSSISNTTYSACIYWSACLRLQIFTNKHHYISSNPNNISRYFPLIWDEIVDRGTELSGLHNLGIFLFFFRNIAMSSEWRFTNYKRFSYTWAPLSNTLWRHRANKVYWMAFSKSKE